MRHVSILLSVVILALATTGLSSCRRLAAHDPAQTLVDSGGDVARDGSPDANRSDGFVVPDAAFVEAAVLDVNGDGPPTDTCGNGIKDPAEQCDRGPLNSDLPDALCRSDCKRRRCGDGIIDGGEQCDDGNTNDADGCTKLCAVVGASVLTASPSPLHFGAVGIGCGIPPKLKVSLHNGGGADVKFMTATLVGCPSDLAAPPPPPKTLGPGASMDIFVTFNPTAQGSRSCALRIAASDGVAFVPITAEAAAKVFQTDRFEQRLDRAVDFIFLVDGGGSMSAEQPALVAAAQVLVSELKKNAIDFRIAFVALAPLSAAVEGQLEGTPPFFTTKSSNAQLAQGFLSGFKPPGGGSETGFAALLATLTPPRVAVLATNCSGCSAPNSCAMGLCLTPNAAFRRPGASLEVLAVTDEEDQSTETVAQTATTLRGLVNPLLGHFVRVHSLVPTSNCGPGAAPLRWQALSAATGGSVYDLCASDYVSAMTAVAVRTFGLLDTFFLGRVPVGSVSTKVDGAVVSTTYNAVANAIVFTTPPPNGAVIEASYTTSCN